MTFNFEAAGIGSLPFKSAKDACQIILDNFDEIPFWPQLPHASFRENMYVQYSERFPGLVIDEEKKTVYVDTNGVAETIEETYAHYLDGDVEFFKISEGYAQGLYALLDRLSGAPQEKMKFVKGQITGPVSYGLFLTDQNKKSVIYDKDLFEVMTKTLVMKARWQIRKLKKVFSSVIIFIDEPYLVSIGSSFVNLDAATIAAKVDELIDAIKTEGALCGIHCCGNTDWSFILKRPIDILSFDAYNFTKEFALYSADIKNFFEHGGSIAWGIVPSSDEIDSQTKKGLVERFESAVKTLADKGVDTKNISSLITPSCGVGSLSEERARKVLETTRALSDKLKTSRK